MVKVSVKVMAMILHAATYHAETTMDMYINVGDIPLLLRATRCLTDSNVH